MRHRTEFSPGTSDNSQMENEKGQIFLFIRYAGPMSSNTEKDEE